MNRLLKADVEKLKHDKALLVGIILVAVFSLLSTLLFLIIKLAFVSTEEETQAFSNSINVLFMGQTSLSIGSNVGLIAAIVAIIIVAREFNYGTIRNQVIAGFSRAKIYFSQSIVSIMVAIGLYLLNIIMSLLFGLVFLGAETVTGSDVASLFAAIGLSLLIFVLFSLIANFYTNIFKSVGVPIVLYVVTILVLTGLSSVYQLYDFPSWVETVCSFNPMYQSTMAMSAIGNINIITTERLLITLFSEIGYIALVTVLGAYIFKKTDLK